MKEKIKKMFQYICTWKFVMWLSIAFAAYHLVMCFINLHGAYVGGMCWHLGYALVCYFLQKYEDRHREDMFCVASLDYHLAECLVQLNRYKTRYGELPPAAPSVQLQQPSEESEQPQAETQQANAPSVADIPEEPIAEPVPEPSAVSKRPRNINRRPRTAPKKPRTKKSKEEQ